jgi:hypothetical protein
MQMFRQPVDVAFVIDRSGSMEDSLALVLDAVVHASEMLGENDTACVVAYDSTAEVFLQPTRMSKRGRQLLKDAIKCIDLGNVTDISTGIRTGLSLLHSIRLQRSFARPVLCCLTDGIFNYGHHQTVDALEDCLSTCLEEWSNDDEGDEGDIIGIDGDDESESQPPLPPTLHCLGLHIDGEEEAAILRELATRHHGIYFPISSIGDARRAFGACMGLTHDMLFHTVQVQMNWAQQSWEMSALHCGYPASGNSSSALPLSLEFGSLALGEVRSALCVFRLRDEEVAEGIDVVDVQSLQLCVTVTAEAWVKRGEKYQRWSFTPKLASTLTEQIEIGVEKERWLFLEAVQAVTTWAREYTTTTTTSSSRSQVETLTLVGRITACLQQLQGYQPAWPAHCSAHQSHLLYIRRLQQLRQQVIRESACQGKFDTTFKDDYLMLPQTGSDPLSSLPVRPRNESSISTASSSDFGFSRHLVRSCSQLHEVHSRQRSFLLPSLNNLSIGTQSDSETPDVELSSDLSFYLSYSNGQA